MIDNERQREWIRVFSALASDARLQMVLLLAKGQLECQEILNRVDLSQPAISYHLGKLERAGILIKEKNGSRNCYRLDNRVNGLIKLISGKEKE
ncbi:winged helix-turn-helix transcriptional regulator [Candidatus Bipolaricaulota bacterium]|nr:winged helix-turn-helix transcriptional regulator [Candidatus Bipolaricaulota bacterium]MCK4683215.1 winged helix-turn-helix transcriptional regulator [Candidatus Bipolaricaulota bacterium]